MSDRIHRRRFIGESVLAGAGLSLAGCASSGTKVLADTAPTPKGPAKVAANEKLNIGIIGVNHRGKANTKGVKSENIVALCDIDANYLAEAAVEFPKAKQYKDWRKLLDDGEVDAVVISTADHHHAFAAVKAMRMGIHVYCEKPLGHSVEEARVVRDTYAECNGKVATQMGTQIHATDNYRRVVELIKGGAIGPVREAHVWCNRVGPGGDTPEGGYPVPAHLSWDLWLGPAPDHAFNPAYLPGNLTWNRYWNFGNGTLGDMGSHLIDLPFWALDLHEPTSAEATGSEVHSVTCPTWMTVTWEHPARGDRPAVKLTWYDADKRPPSPAGIDLKQWGIGVMFIGDKGKLVTDYGKHILLPSKNYREFVAPDVDIESSLGHYKEWIHACKTGAPTLCNFEYSGALIEHNMLGAVAYRVGKKLEWDPKQLKAVNCPEADQYIRQERREGWTL